jgi:hypothetical protein
MILFGCSIRSISFRYSNFLGLDVNFPSKDTLVTITLPSSLYGASPGIARVKSFMNSNRHSSDIEFVQQVLESLIRTRGLEEVLVVVLDAGFCDIFVHVAGKHGLAD